MLPLRARTLPQAELVHRALVGRIARGERIDCPELIGKDSLGQPLIGHKHAHIVPLDLDQDGHLDHIVVYAPMGLRAGAQRAVRGMKRTWTKGSANDLQVSVVGAGSLESLRSLPAPFARGVDALLGPAEGARVWMSATAFVPPRHLKKTGANALEGQVRAELSSRGLPSAQVETLPMDDVTRALRHMVRVRRAPAAPPPIDMAIPLRLIFDEPVRGPISLGYASHFGLGRFSAHI